MAEIVHESDCEGWPGGRYSQGKPLTNEPCVSWCFHHNRCEPPREGDYRTCPECLHIFRTEEELIKADLEVRKFWSKKDDDRPVLTGDAIHSCPHCAHDF